MKAFLHRMAPLAFVLGLTLGVTSTAFAAVQGDPLKLGIGNTINLFTSLTGSVASSMLRVTNTNTAVDASAIRAVNNGGGPAVDMRVKAGAAPMVVNSAGKVANLNADQLDGFTSTQFMGANTFTVESPLGLGTDHGDGTFTAKVSCPAGSIMLSGGPANLSGTSVMVESFPQLLQPPIWKARIHPQGLTDNWSVVALCARLQP